MVCRLKQTLNPNRTAVTLYMFSVHPHCIPMLTCFLFLFPLLPFTHCAGPLAAWPVFQVHSPGNAGPYQGGVPVPPGAVSQVRPRTHTHSTTWLIRRKYATKCMHAAHANLQMTFPDTKWKMSVVSVLYCCCFFTFGINGTWYMELFYYCSVHQYRLIDKIQNINVLLSCIELSLSIHE